MWAGGWVFSGQRWGVTGGWGHRQCWWELFSQQPERVRRVLPLARFPMGGLQARPSHLETDTDGDGESEKVFAENYTEISGSAVYLVSERVSRKNEQIQTIMHISFAWPLCDCSLLSCDTQSGPFSTTHHSDSKVTGRGNTPGRHYQMYLQHVHQDLCFALLLEPCDTFQDNITSSTLV